MTKKIDDTGNRYGRLLVQSCFVHKGYTRCVCLCDCGNTTTVSARSIRHGNTKSCGCLLKVHGEYRSQVYRAWKSIKERCFNPKNKSYDEYGGAGITMSPLWKDDYIAFRDHIGHPPEDGQKYSVDRIDGNKGYIPGNLRWATAKEQSRNLKMFNNNATGITGVCFCEGRYKVTWQTLESKQKSRSFSVNKYGKEEAFRLACEARENAIKELNAQGAGYSENHGK